MGLTMKHAGVAITVTSLTDTCAFLVGCGTVYPGLQSFSLSCGIGILAIYVLQLTWFTAWLSIDTRRINLKRNACFPCCWKHPEDWNPFQITKVNYKKRILEKYLQLLDSDLYRMCVYIVTVSALGVGTYGLITMQTHFDETKLLPPGSYVGKWYESHKKMYPSAGFDAKIYTGAMNPNTDLEEMNFLVHDLQSEVMKSDYLENVDSWWAEFKKFLLEKYRIVDWKKQLLDKYKSTGEKKKDRSFYALLSEFLFTPVGAKYQENFVLNGTLDCGSPSPEVLATSTTITFNRIEGHQKFTRAKNYVDELIQKRNFSSKVFATSYKYRTWETVESIGI